MAPLLKAARLVTVASILYYSADEILIPDSEFDDLTEMLVDRWDRLDPYCKWSLGSQEEISTSGFHIKASWAAIGAADHQLLKFGKTLDTSLPSNYNPDHCVHWAPVAGLSTSHKIDQTRDHDI